MGVYANTVSFAQYRIQGALPQEDRFQWLSAALAGRQFHSIEESAEEQSEGWTCTDTPDDPLFEAPQRFWRDRYLFFSYRRDQRRIPGALLKSHVGRAEGEYLAKRPELKRPPKREREEIAERVKLQLLARSLPAPSTIDLVWQMDQGVLTLFSSSAKAMERFEELFSKSFENLRPQLIYPYSRALTLLDDAGREQLALQNQAGSEAALEEIQANRWLGEEFLLWLLHAGLEGEGFRVAAAGHFENGTPFSAWIDDRIQLQGGGEGGPQKVAVSGIQDRYLEARSALKSGKAISSAAIHMEKDELQWRFVLNAELFTFSSFKCPPVKVEREGVEELTERESAFYERLYLLEAGLQMFDSLLLQFLAQRLGAGWAARLQEIGAWLEGEQA
ncbi:MAG: exonuclease [Geobacter sp.]|nr:exonuclease [Geobacter sp.]